MSKRNKNIATAIQLCNDKISYDRHSIGTMFQVVYGCDDKQDYLSIATIFLDTHKAFLLKKKLIDAKEEDIHTIHFLIDEMHEIHLHSDPCKQSQTYETNVLFHTKLDKDTIVAMTPTTLKNWNKMKSCL